MKEKLPLIILLVLALATRFIFLAYPTEVVFDEVHFGKFISAYSTHQYYFDIHPPLGKLIIAGFSSLFGFEQGQAFKQIGEQANSHQLLVLRFLPALFGVLLPLVFYGIIRVLGGSIWAAFLAGFLVVFDNAFLIESKFILVDSFLFFFGFLSLWLALCAKKQELFWKRLTIFALAAVSAGLAVSIKWTGLSFVGIVGFIAIIDFFKNISWKKFGELGLKILTLLGIVFIIYALPFIIHFRLLNLSGPGDAFMSREFQQTLAGNTAGQGNPLPFWAKFAELNQKMYFYNSTLTNTHPDGSKWSEWLVMRKPVWYWHKDAGDKAGDIYLIGNPLIWLSCLTVLFLSIFKFWKNGRWILLLGFFANLLPFIFVSRVSFLYHYLPSLGFAILLLALFFDRKKTQEVRPPAPYPAVFYWGYLALVLIAFLALSPISYGFIVPKKLDIIYQFLVNLLH